MPAVRTDLAIIGGGLSGLATAWALRRQGREVLLLEQARVGHGAGGSHGACRIFRLGYDDPHYVALARQARELWTDLEGACGERLLHPTPQLTFGPQLPQVRDAMAQAGAACEQLPAGAAAERFPGVVTTGEVLLEPDSAVIAADRVLAVLADGAEIRAGQRVTALTDDGRRVRLETSTGQVEADCAIICAGPWTAGLLATAGISLPGSTTLEQVTYLEPAGAAGPPGAAPGMPIFVHYGGEFPYGLPVPGSRRYKLGIHHGGPAVHPDHQDHTTDPGLASRIEQAARTILPGFDPRPAAVERCVYDNTPDEDFVVDRIGNVVIGSGTSGHGFKFGPLLGEWLAFLATKPGRQSREAGRTLSAPPPRFALSRFRP